MEKIKAAELLNRLGIPALSDDDLEWVTGGSSEGLNLGGGMDRRKSVQKRSEQAI